MANEVVMPRMGLTMEEGTVVSWHKKEGDPIVSGEVLLEIETDKVTTEIEASKDGVLGKILIQEGVTVPIGTPIAIIIGEGEEVPASLETVPAQKKEELETTPATKQEHSTAPAIETTHLRASPAARRAARELGMELNLIQGKGPLGRILESDVRRAHAARQMPAEKRVTPVAARMAADLGIDLNEIQGSGPRGAIRKTDLSTLEPTIELESEIVELSRAKKLIAERMAYSFSTAPQSHSMRL